MIIIIIISFFKTKKKTLNSYALPALFSDFGYQNEKGRKKEKRKRKKQEWLGSSQLDKLKN